MEKIGYLLISKLDEVEVSFKELVVSSIILRTFVNSPGEAATYLYREDERFQDPNLFYDLFKIDLDNLTVEKVMIPKIIFEGK